MGILNSAMEDLVASRLKSKPCIGFLRRGIFFLDIQSDGVNVSVSRSVSQHVRQETAKNSLSAMFRMHVDALEPNVP